MGIRREDLDRDLRRKTRCKKFFLQVPVVTDQYLPVADLHREVLIAKEPSKPGGFVRIGRDWDADDPLGLLVRVIGCRAVEVNDRSVTARAFEINGNVRSITGIGAPSPFLQDMAIHGYGHPRRARRDILMH